MYTLFTSIMFLSVTNFQSSNIEELRVSPGNSQAIVKFKGNDTSYLYNGVDFSALYNLLYREVDSLGKWVNEYLKVDSVQCIAI